MTRTFIFENEAQLDAIRPLLLNEVKAGITVKYAFVANLHAELVSGMVLIDDGLAGELRLTPEKGVKEAVFYTQPNDITTYAGKINQVQSNAMDLNVKGSQEADSK